MLKAACVPGIKTGGKHINRFDGELTEINREKSSIYHF